MSRMLNYIEKHALPEAKRQKLSETVNLYKGLERDLEKNIENLRRAVEGLSKKGKFK